MYQPDETSDNTLSQTTINASQQTPSEDNTIQYLRVCVGQLIMQLRERYSVVSYTERHIICKLGLMYMAPSWVCRELNLTLSSVIDEITQTLQTFTTLTKETELECPLFLQHLIALPNNYSMDIIERIYSENLESIREQLRVPLRKSDRLIHLAKFFGKPNAVTFLQQLQQRNNNHAVKPAATSASNKGLRRTGTFDDLYAASTYVSLRNSPSPDLFTELSNALSDAPDPITEDIHQFYDHEQPSYEDAYPLTTTIHMPTPKTASSLQWQHLNAYQQQTVLAYTQSESFHAFIYSNELVARLQEHGVECSVLALTPERAQSLPAFQQIVQNANFGDQWLTFNIILVHQDHFDVGMAVELEIITPADFLQETAPTDSTSDSHVATIPTSSSSCTPNPSLPTSSSKARTPSPLLGRNQSMFHQPATSSVDTTASGALASTETATHTELMRAWLEQSLRDLEPRPHCP